MGMDWTHPEKATRHNRKRSPFVEFAGKLDQKDTRGRRGKEEYNKKVGKTWNEVTLAVYRE